MNKIQKLVEEAEVRHLTGVSTTKVIFNVKLKLGLAWGVVQQLDESE